MISMIKRVLVLVFAIIYVPAIYMAPAPAKITLASNKTSVKISCNAKPTKVSRLKSFCKQYWGRLTAAGAFLVGGGILAMWLSRDRKAESIDNGGPAELTFDQTAGQSIDDTFYQSQGSGQYQKLSSDLKHGPRGVSELGLGQNSGREQAQDFGRPNSGPAQGQTLGLEKVRKTGPSEISNPRKTETTCESHHAHNEHNGADFSANSAKSDKEFAKQNSSEVKLHVSGLATAVPSTSRAIPGPQIPTSEVNTVRLTSAKEKGKGREREGSPSKYHVEPNSTSVLLPTTGAEKEKKDDVKPGGLASDEKQELLKDYVCDDKKIKQALDDNNIKLAANHLTLWSNMLVDNGGKNVHHYAVAFGNEDLVEYLLKMDAIRFKNVDKNGLSPLGLAWLKNNVDIELHFRNKGAKISVDEFLKLVNLGSDGKTSAEEWACRARRLQRYKEEPASEIQLLPAPPAPSTSSSASASASASTASHVHAAEPNGLGMESGAMKMGPISNGAKLDTWQNQVGVNFDLVFQHYDGTPAMLCELDSDDYKTRPTLYKDCKDELGILCYRKKWDIKGVEYDFSEQYYTEENFNKLLLKYQKREPSVQFEFRIYNESGYQTKQIIRRKKIATFSEDVKKRNNNKLEEYWDDSQAKNFPVIQLKEDRKSFVDEGLSVCYSSEWGFSSMHSRDPYILCSPNQNKLINGNCCPCYALGNAFSAANQGGWNPFDAEYYATMIYNLYPGSEISNKYGFTNSQYIDFVIDLTRNEYGDLVNDMFGTDKIILSTETAKDKTLKLFKINKGDYPCELLCIVQQAKSVNNLTQDIKDIRDLLNQYFLKEEVDNIMGFNFEDYVLEECCWKCLEGVCFTAFALPNEKGLATTLPYKRVLKKWLELMKTGKGVIIVQILEHFTVLDIDLYRKGRESDTVIYRNSLEPFVMTSHKDVDPLIKCIKEIHNRIKDYKPN